MQIVTSKPLPTTPEIAEVLKQEVSSRYSYELFVEEQIIFVSESNSVKAQIAIHENQILVQAFSNSLFEAIMINLCMSELGLVLIPLFFQEEMQLHSRRTELEKELSLFLEHKYNRHNSGIEQSKKDYP